MTADTQTPTALTVTPQAPARHGEPLVGHGELFFVEGYEIDASSHRWRVGLPDISREVTVSVVIPALNEEGNLPHVLTSLPPNLHEVVLVDGRSTDATVDVARRVHPSIVVVEQEGSGKGDALRTGFAHCTGDIIVMLDADGSMAPGEIPRFVAALLRGADYVKGSRFLSGGGSADLTAMRNLGNWALRAFGNVMFGTRYTDLCYGYNAFWRRCLPIVIPDCEGFEVETLMNVRAHTGRLRVAEVPSYEAARISGESKLRTWSDGYRVLRTIVRERPRRPMPGAVADVGFAPVVRSRAA